MPQMIGLGILGVSSLWMDVRAQSPPAVLKSLAEIRRISRADAELGLPVEFQGVVAARIRPKSRLFVVDDSKVLPLMVEGTNLSFLIGQRLRVRGKTAVISGVIHCLPQDISPIGSPGPAPPGAPTTIPQLNEEDLVYHWVNVKGRIQSVTMPTRARGRMLLLLRDRGQTFPVTSPQIPDVTEDDLRYASLEVTGLVLPAKSGVTPGSLALWVGGNNLNITKPPPRYPYTRAQFPIAELLEYRDSNRLPTRMFKLRARVGREASEGGVWLDDGTGQIRFLARPTDGLRPGDWIDVVGFLAREGDEILMDTGSARIIAPVLTDPNPPASDDGQATNRVASVRSIAELLRMERATLARGWPVRLQALVSYVDTPRRLFVRTADGGVEVRLEKDFQTQPGAWVLIDGHVNAGLHGPVIAAATIELTEPSDANALRRMPAPRRVFQSGIIGKRYQSQWVLGDANVRRVMSSTNGLQIVLARSGPRFTAVLRHLVEAGPMNDLLGRRVKVIGVGDMDEGNDRRPTLRILVPSSNEMSVSGSSLGELADDPAVEIAHLFDLEAGPLIRARRVEGVVTFREQQRLFLADTSGSIAVLSDQAGEVNVGDVVSAIGYPVSGDHHRFLEDALLQSRGRDRELPPQVVPASRVLYGNHDGELIAMAGRLIGQTRSDDEHFISVNDGLRVITAVLPFQEVTPEIINLAPDSELRLTGICEYRLNHRREVESYQLLLRSGKDLALVAPAPWWTGDRLLMAVVGLLVVVLGSLGWVNFLRRRVEQTQGRFAAAFQASPVPVAIVTRADFRFINVNESFLTQFGFQRPEVIGMTADALGLFPVPEKKQRLLDRLVAGSSVQDFEGEIRTKEGRERDVIISAEVIDLDGEESLLVLFQDVTERVNLMNQLRESQKMEAIGQLAAGVAHDFNNLLTIIRGNSELIGMKIDRESEVAELNCEMNDAAARAADLTRQLLAFSRKQVMRKTATDLNGIVVGSTKMLQRLLGEKISVRQELAPATVPLIADAGMLDQIIMNLAVNARDAMPEGGRLTLRTSVVVYHDANLPAHADARPGEYAVLEIADTGEGISPETQKRIFEPFFTTKEIGKGTGLGLSTVYGIVRQHKGWIEVESEPGQGTCFRFLLPAATPEELRAGVDTSSTAFFQGTETVLVVEDEDAVRRMMQRTLTACGYTVLTASDGPMALEIWATERERVDLLVTDLVMPNGLSGVDLAREFSADRPELAMIFVSGYSADVMRGEGEVPQGSGFVAKPFTRDTLMTAVRKALNARREGAVSSPAAPPQSAHP